MNRRLLILILLFITTVGFHSIDAQEDSEGSGKSQESVAVEEHPIPQADREHWAFQSLSFNVPKDEGEFVSENPIDCSLLRSNSGLN